MDIELRVAIGALRPPDVAPAGQLPITDGATVGAVRRPAASAGPQSA